VHILATSREALAISGGHIYHLPSLSLPPADELRALTIDDALRSQARYLANDLAAARSFYREALAAYKGVGRERLAATAAANLAEAEFQAGDIESALQIARDAVEIFRANNKWVTLTGALSNCSAYLVALARFEEARSFAREALALAREASFDAHVAWALQHLAAIAALRASDCPADPLGDRQSAARVLGFVDARFAQLESGRQYTEQQEYERTRSPKCARPRSRRAHERRRAVVRRSGGRGGVHDLRRRSDRSRHLSVAD
jgi:tetratricopeptide (TPR) repeat protein